MTYSVHTTDTRYCKARLKLTKPLVVSAMSALLLAAPFALQPQPVRSQTVHLVEVDVKVAAAGYRSSKLIGKSVLNDNNEDLGKLDDIVLGPDAKANFAILQVGGFLGIGSRLVAVPFESLKIDKAGDKIVLPGASKTALEKLTEFKYGQSLHPAYRIYAMISRKIDRKEWRSFLDSLQRLLEGKQAEVEVASLDLGDQIEVEWLPLIGLVYDPKDNVVQVALDGTDHVIYQPQEIYFAEEAGRFFGIDIVDGKGVHQIVKMKEPLMLPAPQAQQVPGRPVPFILRFEIDDRHGANA